MHTFNGFIWLIQFNTAGLLERLRRSCERPTSSVDTAGIGRSAGPIDSCSLEMVRERERVRLVDKAGSREVNQPKERFERVRRCSDQTNWGAYSCEKRANNWRPTPPHNRPAYSRLRKGRNGHQLKPSTC